MLLQVVQLSFRMLIESRNPQDTGRRVSRAHPDAVGGQTLPHQALLSPEGVHNLGIRVGRKQLFINLLLQPLVGPYAFSDFVIEDGIGGWRRGLCRHQTRAKNDDFTSSS